MESVCSIDGIKSLTNLNNKVAELCSLVFQRNKTLNPDTCKWTQEALFTGKINQINHPELYFIGNQVVQISFQSTFGYFLNKLMWSQSQVLTMANLRHPTSWIWICAERILDFPEWIFAAAIITKPRCVLAVNYFRKNGSSYTFCRFIKIPTARYLWSSCNS